MIINKFLNKPNLANLFPIHFAYNGDLGVVIESCRNPDERTNS